MPREHAEEPEAEFVRARMSRFVAEAPFEVGAAPGQRRGGDGAFAAVELRALGQAYLASGL